MSTRYLPGIKGGRPARKAENLSAICESISRKCGSLDVSQTYGSPRPVTVIALSFYLNECYDWTVNRRSGAGGARFEYQTGRRLCWGSSWFSSVPPSKFRESTSTIHDHFLSNPFPFIIHSTKRGKNEVHSNPEPRRPQYESSHVKVRLDPPVDDFSTEKLQLLTLLHHKEAYRPVVGKADSYMVQDATAADALSYKFFRYPHTWESSQGSWFVCFCLAIPSLCISVTSLSPVNASWGSRPVHMIPWPCSTSPYFPSQQNMSANEAAQLVECDAVQSRRYLATFLRNLLLSFSECASKALLHGRATAHSSVVFSGYFGLPCQLSFHRLLQPHYHLSSRAGTIGQLVADVPSGLSLTTPQGNLKKIKNRLLERAASDTGTWTNGSHVSCGTETAGLTERHKMHISRK
jgi:hypothetical protein